jgi:hypothetical protein
MKTTILALLLTMASMALAQEHDHNTVIGQWYLKWNMPDTGRAFSCCNNQDCAAVDHVRRQAGQLQMLRKIDGRWMDIPAEKLESNYDDARDSPDGFSHMCSRGETVYCAVLGSGI